MRFGRLADSCPKPEAARVFECWLFDAADIDKPGRPVKTFVAACVLSWTGTALDALPTV